MIKTHLLVIKNCDPVDTKGSGDSTPVDELQGVDSNTDQTSKI